MSPLLVELGREGGPFSIIAPILTSFDVLGNVITPSMDQRDASSSQKAHVGEVVSLVRLRIFQHTLEPTPDPQPRVYEGIPFIWGV